MFSGKISREIGSALSLYSRSQLDYFGKQYLSELEIQLKKLDKARGEFLGYVKANMNYIAFQEQYKDVQITNSEKDVISKRFYEERDKILTDLINDKENRKARKFLSEMEKSEELVFKIRDSLYGGQAETKYHIGIQVNDESGRQLRAFELDPKQMLKVQSDRNIFKAEVKMGKGKDNHHFSVRFTTKENLTAKQLMTSIVSAGGVEYNKGLTMGGFLDTYSTVQRDLQTLQDSTQRIKDLKDNIEDLKGQRKGLPRPRENPERTRIRGELEAIRSELHMLEKGRNQKINFGFGRGFEAQERKDYGLDYRPQTDNSIRYNDNTSWIMQQDVNFFREVQGQQKLIMIQNKFFSEGSQFSTISMQSLYSSLESFKEYFNTKDYDFEEFEKIGLSERGKQKLDEEVYQTIESIAQSWEKDAGLMEI